MAGINISGVSDSRSAYAAGKIIQKKGGQWVVVTPSAAEAARMAADLSFFISKKILTMPAEPEIFVHYEAKNKDVLFGRLRAMRSLLSGEDCVVVTSATGIIRKIPPSKEFLDAVIPLQQGMELNLRELISGLVHLGYERVPLVYAPGQFSWRGEILDVFTPYEEDPFRIELFDTEVESIRLFDAVSQRSIRGMARLELWPATLMVHRDAPFQRAKDHIKSRYHMLQERREELLEWVEQGINSQQLENYIDYFYEHPAHLWDEIQGSGGVIIDDPNHGREIIEVAEKEFLQDFEVYQEKGRVTAPDLENFPSLKDWQALYAYQDLYLLTPFDQKLKGCSAVHQIQYQTHQTMMYHGKLRLLERDLQRYVEDGYKVTIVCSTGERQTNMQEFLNRIGLLQRIWVKEGVLSSGMELPDDKICYLTDGDIFGTTMRRHHRHRRMQPENSTPIRHFSEIQKGDYVVHESHGIGQYEGLESLTVAGETREFLKVRYAGNDILYVPAEQMQLIQKYIGSGAAAPRINKLAGGEWQATKAKARASIAGMAEELLEISAARKSSKGYAFEQDTVWQKEFEEEFPYEETPDQLRCIREIKADMEKPETMDRLLCGDVGFGKTEVAARAMFKAAAEGKQVAMLVPTTVLASQHYRNLKKRFASFPFHIEMISRFRNESQQKETVDGLRKGTVDIVIGTHRLLSNDVAFHDLGLLVVDEEQRFGVSHKEKIKQMKKEVDVLTLSATPIPRTLHMSLLGIRDMSLIEEPPAERYPVQTYVMEQDDHVVAEAIRRELDRGGQVYVVHNRVAGIYRIADWVDRLVPGKRIVVCHGRMNEVAMEDAMMTFIEGGADILVATTIIENGMDIPNVNTLIVLDADQLGLSQLYQLRGRVGRSSRMAYAYLMHRPGKMLSEVASKRLKAIRDFTEFGAGFKIAMQDLEIRGAGNLLGREQHGHMVNVGYELYSRMVDQAVRALKGETVPTEPEETVIDRKDAALIPEQYIRDETARLSMYKRIASIGSEEEETEILEELTDRFGAVPEETRNLVRTARVRSLAERLDLRKVIIRRSKVTLQFDKKKKLKPQTVFLNHPEDPLTELIELFTMMGAR